MFTRFLFYIGFFIVAVIGLFIRSDGLVAFGLVFATHVLMKDMLEGKALVYCTKSDIEQDIDDMIGDTYDEY